MLFTIFLKIFFRAYVRLSGWSLQPGIILFAGAPEKFNMEGGIRALKGFVGWEVNDFPLLFEITFLAQAKIFDLIKR